MALLSLLSLQLAAGAGRVQAAPPSALSAPARTIVLTSSDDMERSLGRRLTLIYGEALVYRSYPNKRAIAMSDAGAVDGEIDRYASYGDSHPNLVRVETPHFNSSFGAYATRPLTLSEGWSAFAPTDYRVEYRAGSALCAEMLPAVVERQRLTAADSVQSGLRKLARGRIDVYVDVDAVVEQQLALPEFARAGIRRVGQMDAVPMHVFLYKTHRALAQRLAATLLDMRREGLLEKYRIMAEGAAPDGAPAVAP